MASNRGNFDTHRRGIIGDRSTLGDKQREPRLRFGKVEPRAASRNVTDLRLSRYFGKDADCLGDLGITRLRRCPEPPVRRQNIWRNLRRKLAECRPRLGVDIKRRACGAASADVRWSVV